MSLHLLHSVALTRRPPGPKVPAPPGHGAPERVADETVATGPDDEEKVIRQLDKTLAGLAVADLTCHSKSRDSAIAATARRTLRS